MKNIYLIQGVLYDYTEGMVAIIASDLDECRALFIDELANGSWSDTITKEYDLAIKENHYQVVAVGDDEQSRVVSYVYGGG